MFASDIIALSFLHCNSFGQRDSFYKSAFWAMCPGARVHDGKAVRKNRVKIMWKFSGRAIVILLCYSYFLRCLQQGLKWYFLHKYPKGLLFHSVCLFLYFTLVSANIIILLSKIRQGNRNCAFHFFAATCGFPLGTLPEAATMDPKWSWTNQLLFVVEILKGEEVRKLSQ